MSANKRKSDQYKQGSFLTIMLMRERGWEIFGVWSLWMLFQQWNLKYALRKLIGFWHQLCPYLEASEDMDF